MLLFESEENWMGAIDDQSVRVTGGAVIILDRNGEAHWAGDRPLWRHDHWPPPGLYGTILR